MLLNRETGKPEPKDGDTLSNERYHVYDCKRCGKHVEKWVDIRIPLGYKYCNPCAFFLIDAALDRRDKNISPASSKENNN